MVPTKMQAFSRTFPFIILIYASNRSCQGWKNIPPAKCAHSPCGAPICPSSSLYAGDSSSD